MSSQPPAGPSVEERNAFILQTAVESELLNPDQVAIVEKALAEDPALPVIGFLFMQDWLRIDHLDWLEQMLTHHFGLATEPAVVEEAVPETVAAPAEYESLPTDVDFKVSLAGDGALTHLNDYLRLGHHYGASDVHVGVGGPPMIRRGGCLQVMWPRAPRLTAPQTQRLLLDFLTDSQRAQLKERGDLDFCYEVPGMGRFRSSVVRQRLGLDGVFRIINAQVRTMDEIGLPPQLRSLTHFHNGLILVTGPVGSGKSTTLAALVEEVNRVRHEHIITLEDPVELVFEPKGCQVTQREVHTHTESFARALRAALREDPDVIMVGEMRDLETISLAITASETGHLVLGTLHTANAARTLDRVLDVFPIDQQAQIRTMVAGSLRGVISQQLLPRADGQGRALALEILVNNPAAAALIRDGKTHLLPGVMQTAKRFGCKLMDDSLLELLQAGTITAQDAYDYAAVKAPFRQFLET